MLSSLVGPHAWTVFFTDYYGRLKKVGRGGLKLVGSKKPRPQLLCAFPKALGAKIFRSNKDSKKELGQPSS